LSEEHLRLAREGFARDEETLRREHHTRQEGLQREFIAEEDRLTRVRSAPERGDAETLSQVLEAELNDEPLPVPLVLDLELDVATGVRVEVVLPDISEVPEERTQLTKTGRLSSKVMAQRDRTAVYRELCSGMALRLIYETFRVLESVQVVEVFGTAAGTDPSTGQPREVVALHLRTVRADFAKLNLDAVDPSSALEHLGGLFSCDKGGQLSGLPGVTGLTDA
jgi:hypothetical protein